MFETCSFHKTTGLYFFVLKVALELLVTSIIYKFLCKLPPNQADFVEITNTKKEL